MIIPADEFKTALIEALKADSGVAAILGARLYDEVPRDSRGNASDVASPYAYLGPIAASRVESGCGAGWLLRLRLYVASTAFGRREAWQAMNAMVAAIEGETFALAAPAVQAQALYTLLGGDVVEPISPKLVYVDIAAIVAG
ncbi:uncharacterized protein DUF3168 [Methylosinus sp. sav-2]|uniref:DUF3168 domain-containing protein n=1 Tax=Methylosinus sp. sav-2 TaxID=2485168 RepID=UPI0004795BC2|nr:DUF3168 domain-containing protein [Methylosinus sp. sav-2]TDX63999.1 uncharacterized protein DUF3168 [Methylosinus sp. sav-2]